MFLKQKRLVQQEDEALLRGTTSIRRFIGALGNWLTPVSAVTGNPVPF
ncbi:MAG: hypothetical protein IPP66_04125 [Anaerolineales bacterium]|nr:hypothetical protein [Anaerolineales bacterium]